MNLIKFCDEPWKTLHQVYSASALAMTPAPEYANSEVILSSLYRVIGYSGLSEAAVPQAGRELEREIQKFRNQRKERSGAALDADTFYMMLHSTLESPKLPNQSSKRFLQVTPLVPQSAAFSGSARLAGNPWTPGVLVRRMVWLGSDSTDNAHEIWSELFAALSIDNNDDVFARFLQHEMAVWSPNAIWHETAQEESPTLLQSDRDGLAYPARQFCHDLIAVLRAKNSMTRRQWTSLLEAILRIGTVSHIVWLCELHDRTSNCLRASMLGEGPRTIAEARSAMFPNHFSYLSYGDRALPTIKDRASLFLQARIDINAILWGLQEVKRKLLGGLGSAEELLTLCETIRSAANDMTRLRILDIIDEIKERENRTILCNKGTGSNILEFARHMLGQRQSASEILRGYDQGYVLRKKSNSKSSPWVVGLGPVAVLSLVHGALAGTTGPRSVRRLAQHLAGYGISVDHREISINDLGHQLRMLGLVLDSPDAESGMLLVPPFIEQKS